MSTEPDEDYFNDKFEDECMEDVCPNCGAEYDEIDFEYQICHYCGFNNNPLSQTP